METDQSQSKSIQPTPNQPTVNEPVKHVKHKRYDWPMLKAEYFASDFVSVAEFLRSKEMEPKYFLKQTTGWTIEKKNMKNKAVEKTADKIIQDDMMTVTDVRNRQARLSRFLQLKGAKALDVMPVENIDDARKLVVSGMEQERRSLGMEGNTTNQTLTQINIQAKTQMDKIVEGLDYEGVLRLIAELKRERDSRGRTIPATSGAGKVQEGKVI